MIEEDAQWKDRAFVTGQFPHISLFWGQENSQTRSIVTYYRKKYKKNSKGM